MTTISSVLPSTSTVDSQATQSLSTQIKTLIPQFQKGTGKFLTETVQHINYGGTNFYGIRRDRQMHPHNIESTVKRYAEIKSHLLAQIGLPPNTPIVQVVGDSAAYGPQGTHLALQFLDRYLDRNDVILYGYTGHAKPDGRKCANAAVSAFAEKHGVLKNTIGNLVGFHTPAALDSWGCTGPSLNHYFLIYGDDESKRETGTVFGDDITTSDFLSDMLLMVEGGIQSFRQACNFLLLGRPIRGYSHLRRDSETGFAKMADGTVRAYFSAPDFLEFIKLMKEQHKGPITDTVLDDWYNAYLSNKVLSDPKRQDHDTKKKLLDEAWNLFKAQKLYEKLDLFTLTPPACDLLGKAYFHQSKL